MENFESNPRLYACHFANHDGILTESGAAIKNTNSSPYVWDCTFDSNRIGSVDTPFGQGGAIYNDNSFPEFVSCEFTSNLAQQGGVVFNYNYSEPRFSQCLFENNQAERGGVVYSEMEMAWFDACKFFDNVADYGGAVYTSETHANPRFYNCIFAGNQAERSGGAIFAGNLSVPQLINCVLWGNAAATGGTGNGGAIFETYTQPLVLNSIIWGNSPNQIYDSSGETHVTYSDVQGGFPGTGNIYSDPLFIDSAGYDFELEPASPCIDTGSTEGGTSIDIAVAPRPQGTSTDMGVYEYAGGPMIQVVPDVAHFGDVVVGTGAELELTVRNTGLANLSITGMTFASGANFSLTDGTTTFTILPGDELALSLTFSPGKTGAATDTLSIVSNSVTGDLDISLYGAGIIAPHTITASGTAGGTIDPAGSLIIPDGEDVAFTLTADTGYEISDLLVDGSSEGAAASYTFSSVDADHTIEAVFKPLTFTITATAGSGGAISPSGDVSVTYGDSRTFTISTDSGYIVSDVVVDGSSVGAVDSHTFSDVTADHTIAVTFDTPHYFITATAGSGGSISPSGTIRVEEGATQTFTIAADEWLDNADVLVDGVSVGIVSIYTFADVDADHTIEAVFADLVPDVWVDDDYSAGGDNDGHTWHVDAFASVQEGINAVTGPAIVHVAAGTYNEQIALKSGVQVLGSDPENTILDVEGVIGDGIVVTALNVDSTATLAGFTIINGRRTTSTTLGRGMNLTNSSPVIRDCIFEANQTVALQNDNSSPQISDCIFRNNAGGGMRNINGSNPVLDNCRFETNDTYGMENVNSSPELTNCDFIGNFVIEAVSPSGGGMYNYNSSPRVVDCRFIDNRLDTTVDFKGGGGGMYNTNNSSPEILRCEFTGNAAAKGGAIYISGSSPTITDCSFTSNEGDVYDDDQGGAICIGPGSAPVIANCVFTGNSGYRGGAIYFSLGTTLDTPATVTNCIFNGNTAMRHGGAIFTQFSGGALHIVNSVFYNNEPDSDADGLGAGGALYNDRADVTMVNTIAWNNDSSEIESNVAVVVQYSDIEGGYGLAADMNIDFDPLFMDAAAGNFRLRTGSPCIDAGTSSGTITLPATDIEGTSRPVGIRHDIGAYEYAAGQDINISPTSLDFGDVAVGSTGVEDISISNTGDVDLAISGVALSDDTHYTFAFADLPAIVAPGEALTLTVTFAPTATGQQDADLTVTSNDPDESPLTVSLTGTGLHLMHTIDAVAGSGGSITPSGSIDVADGGDQSFIIAADGSYIIANVMVDGVSVGAVSSYAFSDVTTDHTIEAQFAPPAGIITGAVSGSIGEDGSAATFTVRLSSRPSDTVQLPLAVDDVSEAILSTDSVTFTTSNWQTPQTITITGVDDDIDDGDQTVTVGIGPAVSADVEYDGADPDDLTVVNTDDDTADIIVSAVTGHTDEGGAAATFTVALASEPTVDVEISIASDDATEADVSPVVLVFTSANWNTPQTITVTGVDDDEADGDISYAILLAAISGDSIYDGMNPPDIPLINLDDEDAPPAGTGGDDDGDGGGGGGGGGCFIHSLAGNET